MNYSLFNVLPYFMSWWFLDPYVLVEISDDFLPNSLHFFRFYASWHGEFILSCYVFYKFMHFWYLYIRHFFYLCTHLVVPIRFYLFTFISNICNIVFAVLFSDTVNWLHIRQFSLTSTSSYFFSFFGIISLE